MQHHQRRPALSLCFFGVAFSRLAFLRCCSDEGCRVAIPLQGTREVGLLRFQIAPSRSKRTSCTRYHACTCGKVYIGETKRRLGTRLKEHKDACVRCQTDKSAIAKHAWAEDHPINWSGIKILQRASHTMELVMKVALCIQSTPRASTGTAGTSYLTVGSR